MSSESGRQIRVTIPTEVFERIERTAAALGTTVNDLGSRCVVEGIGPAIVGRISELEQALAALKTEIVPVAKAPIRKPAKADSIKGDVSPDAPPAFKMGRAERAAVERNEQLAEERRHGNRRTRPSNGKEATA